MTYNELSTKAECQVLLRTKDQGANIHNLNYTNIGNLSTEVNADSELNASDWGDRLQESLDRFNWSSLVGRDYKNVFQLHNFNDPVFRSPSYLAGNKPAVLVRSDFGSGLGRYVALEYVPLSTLSAIPPDTDLTALNQKSIEQKHQGYGEDSLNYLQLRRFEEGTGDYTLAQLSANRSNLDVLVRDRSSGQIRELKYATLQNFQLSGSSVPASKEIEVITDISFSFSSSTGKITANLTKKKVKILDDQDVASTTKDVVSLTSQKVVVESKYSEISHNFNNTQRNIWTIP